MFDIKKSENMKSFERCLENVMANDVALISISIHGCWELFKVQYGDMPNWKKSAHNQTEWLACLAILEKDILDKEINQELPYGTTNGVYMTILFFKSVTLNEEEHTIQEMSECMEKFNRIGYQISQDSEVSKGLNHLYDSTFKNLKSNIETLVH